MFKIVPILIWAGAVGVAQAQLSFVSQDRWVTAGSICTSTTQTVVAPDFGVFEATAHAGDSGCWGEAVQSSVPGVGRVVALGSTRGYRGSTAIPYPWSTSHVEVVFDISVPTDFRLTTHWDYAMWSLSGPGVSLASFGIFGDRVDAGRLLAGRYTIQANANLEHMGGMIIPTSFSFTLEARCVADVDDGSGTGTPDGGVTTDDLLYYLAIFGEGVLGADVDDGSGTGTLDGGVTIDDLLYYLERFGAGC